ncbi:TetR/AcrR family transcriptional regulator C-terminal domain-containing protein [Actinokineospora baliensis]|uniref:TetR/AcrR family transcriptional regulator C-terminal domain-containing protein n=1 Tax=Actinokineospora baliensis TaxID=547056 RepID=UPI001957055B|nr:TetR/AcrR family transcriptional regulator C-terminal domain-containing protein [Actinokineospora baliensis]
MVVFAAQGDPRRTMALLWRRADQAEVRPGPRPTLSADAIVEAAVAVADAEGMAGLSMRAVGERLGRTAMALYTYVADKSELLDLMYDHVHGELGAGPAEDWRAGVTAWAEELWAFYLRHPWVLHVSMARPVLGPNELDSAERLLRVLEPAALPGPVLRGVVSQLNYLVQGAARMVTDSRRAARETGQSDEDWWYARSAELVEVAPDFGARYPLLTLLESNKDVTPNETVPYMEHEARSSFEVGLRVLLDGIEAARLTGG